MAAKRLGQFLSNVTGTSGQILRVKADESGFEMFTPAGLPTYTITNDTTDRVIDADTTSSDEIVDVLCTLIKDITTLVGGPVAFQWSTSEAVWPFEKDRSGNTLYCKEVDLGYLPNTGIIEIAHGIPSLDFTKIYKFFGNFYHPSVGVMPLPRAHGGASDVSCAILSSTVYIQNWSNYSAYVGKINIIYAK